jgi:hypothetical protein
MLAAFRYQTSSWKCHYNLQSSIVEVSQACSAARCYGAGTDCTRAYWDSQTESGRFQLAGHNGLRKYQWDTY